LAAGLRPSTQRENKSGAGRARHPTECPLCVHGWEGDGVGRANAVRHDAKKRRAREGATQQVPLHVVSHGRIPPVGPLGLLTQGGACRRTHVCEQDLPDERVWRTRVTRPARARPRHKKRLSPPDTCRESGGGPPIRCLARWGTPALARAISQCLLIEPPTIRGLTPGPWQPSSVSAHAMHSADRRVREAQVAITRRSSEAPHCCAALSLLSPSVTPARHKICMRRAASNQAHWKTDGGDRPAQTASRSRHNSLKIPGLGERIYEAGARPRNFTLTADQRAPIPSADRRV